MNGYWSRWSTWSHCNVFCGKGVQTRSRLCDDPSPRGKHGKYCDGQSSQEKVCKFGSCTKGNTVKPFYRLLSFIERPFLSLENVPLSQSSPYFAFISNTVNFKHLHISSISQSGVSPNVEHLPIWCNPLS